MTISPNRPASEALLDPTGHLIAGLPHPRCSPHLFLQRLQGVTTSAGVGAKFHTSKVDIDFAPPRVPVTGKLRHVQDTVHGNEITEADQWAKIERLLEVVHQVWK